MTSCETKEASPVQERMSQIKNKIVVLSGKGVCGDAGESFLENHGQTPAAVAFEKVVEGMNLALELLKKEV